MAWINAADVATAALRRRETYTWSDLADSLANTTQLRRTEAQAVVAEIDDTGLNPYDAQPFVMVLFDDVCTVRQKAHALRTLFDLMP